MFHNVPFNDIKYRDKINEAISNNKHIEYVPVFHEQQHKTRFEIKIHFIELNIMLFLLILHLYGVVFYLVEIKPISQLKY